MTNLLQLGVTRILSTTEQSPLFAFLLRTFIHSFIQSYLVIRTRLNHTGPAIDIAHNRQSAEQNTKLSKTLFIVIGASVGFWVPGLATHCIYFFFSRIVSRIYELHFQYVTSEQFSRQPHYLQFKNACVQGNIETIEK